MEENGIGRVDLKIDNSGCAACVFSHSELLMVRMNGNRFVPKLEGFIEFEKTRRLQAVKDDVGKKYFKEWMKKNVPGFEAHIANAD